MAKTNTTKITLTPNVPVQVSTSPENVEIDVYSVSGGNVYAFTSDSPTPTVPDAPLPVVMGVSRSFGEPFNAWVIFIPNGSSTTTEAIVTTHTWDS